MAGAVARAASLVDDSAQRPKEIRGAVDFVDDDQLTGLRTQVGIRIGHTPPVGRPLEVEVDCVASPGSRDLLCQGGLADLAGTEQNHGRHSLEARLDRGAETAFDEHLETPES